ncbi:hypothetical protein OUZ56_010023 [Daphnia magna]|uniref:Uncharacterized protein n=1 Tax=Daphnia magna TaxID=35525 RepID=A0ABR0AHJ9_9CRUS|nr:hypothetical protein OUZ56_010023 [Daphnia magna]
MALDTYVLTDQTGKSSRRHVFIEIPPENSILIDIISELLQRNDRARLTAEITGEQIHMLVTEEDKHPQTFSTRHPERLAAHEQHDVVN